MIPPALLGIEFLALSLLVDFPVAGPAVHLVRGLQLVVPVALGAAAGGYLLTRQGLAHPPTDDPLPAWRPWPALALQLAAFAATAVLARALMGPASPPLTPLALGGWTACAATAALLALASAAPLSWFLRRVAGQWRVPLLAVAIGVLSWRAAVAAERLWGALSSVTLRGVAALLAVRGDVTADLDTRVIGVGDFLVEIAPVCSGADGIGLVVIFQAVWLALARARIRFPAALLLLPLGALAAFAANVVRIAALVAVGASGHEELAIGGFHSKLGWVLFVLIALGSIAVVERVPWLQRPGPRADLPPAVEGETAYVAPLLAALATALVTSLWSEGGLDRLYVVRVAAAALVLLLLRRALPSPRLSWSWAPVALGLAVCALWIAWPAGDPGSLPTGLARLAPAERWAWIAARVAGGTLLVPVVEELAFRGFLLPWLAARRAPERAPPAWSPAAILVSSLAFGAMHGDWLLGTVAGIGFAVARLWRGRLGDAIVAHAVANAGLAVAVLLGGRWDLWT